MTRTLRQSLTALLVGLSLTATGCYRSLDTVIRKPILADYPVDSVTFRDTMGNLLGAPLVDGNAVTELKNGDRIFSAMLQDIRAAKRSITLEQYIWSSGAVSDLFIPALVDRAKAGVKVYVTIDSIGSAKLKHEDRQKLKDAGVHLIVYNSLLFSRFWTAKHRTHRKLLVVDGKIGYIGGVCLSDEWRGDAQPGRWRDSMFRVEGPVVGQIQRAYLDNWIQETGEALHGDDFFPHLKKAGDMTAQCFTSGPRGGADSARMNYLVSFAAARKSIRISHAYFAPDRLIVNAILAARRRGVKVEIIFPKKIDNVMVKKASWSEWKELMEAGVEFYQYKPTLYHCKIVIVDDIWCMVGSVNFDQRSLRINDEANMNVLDRDFAKTLIKSFDEDKAQSQRTTLDDLRKRNIFSKVSDRMFGLMKSEL